MITDPRGPAQILSSRHPEGIAARHYLMTIRTSVSDAQCVVAWLEDLHPGLRDGTRSWREWDERLGAAQFSEAQKQGIAEDECWLALEAARQDLAALLSAAPTTAAPAEESNSDG